MTPVLYCHYRNWTTHLPRPRSLLERDPHWRLRVDRSKQFSEVHSNTVQMLESKSPAALAYVWYGEEDQGVKAFGERLEVELKGLAPDVRLWKLTIDWTTPIPDEHSAFQHMFTSAVRGRNIFSVDDIPLCVASEFQGESGGPIIIYIDHAPVSLSVVRPEYLRKFLRWWVSNFVKALNDRNKGGDEKYMFAVIGLSFTINNAEEFRSHFGKHEINDWYFKRIRFRLLDELGNLVKRDLLECLEAHQINSPPKRRNKVLQGVLDKTGGRYDPTLEELREVEPLLLGDSPDEDEDEDS